MFHPQPSRRPFESTTFRVRRLARTHAALYREAEQEWDATCVAMDTNACYSAGEIGDPFSPAYTGKPRQRLDRLDRFV